MPVAAVPEQSSRTAAPGFITGRYMPSGDPGIDRMVALERALKQYGTPR